MDQMMGNLFYRGVQPNLINEMDFFEMKEWNRWHEVMAKQTEKVTKEISKIGK